MKTTVEQDLLEIKQCKIDMLILQRANDKLCETNNNEIGRLAKVIEGRETLMEGKLKTSGEKKIETSAGYVSFREMPDKWVYEDKKLIEWCKRKELPYYHITEVLEKMKLKQAIINGEIPIGIEGIEITPQDPKFTYKLKGGLL